jgi:hypothetical protein
MGKADWLMWIRAAEPCPKTVRRHLGDPTNWEPVVLALVRRFLVLAYDLWGYLLVADPARGLDRPRVVSRKTCGRQRTV